MKPDFRG